MTQPDKEQLVVERNLAGDPTIASLLWMLEDSRRLTLEAVAGLDVDHLDWEPAIGGNSVGALLYHIAAIEMDWLYAEVLTREPPADVLARFPLDVRDADGHLARWRGEALPALSERLTFIRQKLIAVFASMTAENFRRSRTLPDYDVTPEWVLYHLLEHETAHRGEIGMIKLMAAQAGAPA
ncbi:MAG: DinB family protein [Thermomicrobiales bacterium]|nr:DinB family protein [Thermomicrobiales bacterium]